MSFSSVSHSVSHTYARARRHSMLALSFTGQENPLVNRLPVDPYTSPLIRCTNQHLVMRFKYDEYTSIFPASPCFPFPFHSLSGDQYRIRGHTMMSCRSKTQDLFSCQPTSYSLINVRRNAFLSPSHRIRFPAVKLLMSLHSFT